MSVGVIIVWILAIIDIAVGVVGVICVYSFLYYLIRERCCHDTDEVD
jgi:hypothetical protein